jgi:DNA-binding HxlR family transcriptional regulator
VLALLGDEWTAALIGELAKGPLSATELERRLCPIAHAPLVERLKDLSLREIVVRERRSRGASRGQCALSERGRGLAEIVAEAARLETEQPGSAVGRAVGGGAAGALALSLVADGHNRAIGRALAHGPLSGAEIERKLPGAAHASLSRRLRELERVGAVTVRREPSGRSACELSAYGRRLALLALHAASWERCWASPDAQPPSDVGGLVHVIAPLARISRRFAGACRLHVVAPTGEPPIDFAVCAGRIEALPLTPSTPFDAHGRAAALAWDRALLDGDLGGVEVEGDRALLSAAVVALSTALHG